MARNAQRPAILFTLLYLFALPCIAHAQSAIGGVVRDTSGAVLPGVTVEASSDVLIERSRSVLIPLDGGVTAALAVTLGGYAAGTLTWLALLARHRPGAIPDLGVARIMVGYGFRAYVATLFGFLVIRVDTLFVDEAHHVAARTWSEFREHFDDRRVMQFTATPFRRDGPFKAWDSSW